MDQHQARTIAQGQKGERFPVPPEHIRPLARGPRHQALRTWGSGEPGSQACLYTWAKRRRYSMLAEGEVLTMANGGSGGPSGPVKTNKGTVVMGAVVPQPAPQHAGQQPGQPQQDQASGWQRPEAHGPSAPAQHYPQQPVPPVGYHAAAPSPGYGQQQPPVGHAQAHHWHQGGGAHGAIVGLSSVPHTEHIPKATAAPHWPIPPELLQRLPQPNAEQTVEHEGAQVPFSGSGSVLEWLHYAAEVHHQDKAAEAAKKRLGFWIIVCFVGGFLGLFLFFIGIIPLVIGIFLWRKRARIAKLDVEDRRLEVLSGVLTTLAPELKEKKAVGVALDFSAYTQHVKLKQKNFLACEQRWLELELPLKDGTQATVTVTLQVKQKSRSKRKYTKVKAKHREQVTVRLRAPGGHSFSGTGAQRFRGRSVQGMSLSQVVVAARHATLTWSTGVTLRVNSRYGWQNHGVALLDSRRLVAVLVASYQLVAAGERQAA